MFQLLKNVNDPQVRELLKRLMCAKTEFVKCDEVPAHDIGVYGYQRVTRIEGKLDGKPVIILLGLP